MDKDVITAAANQEAKPEESPKGFRVLVPVFLAVIVDESDDLAAEVVAEEVVKAMDWHQIDIGDRKVSVRVESILKTAVEPIVS